MKSKWFSEEARLDKSVRRCNLGKWFGEPSKTDLVALTMKPRSGRTKLQYNCCFKSFTDNTLAAVIGVTKNYCQQ